MRTPRTALAASALVLVTACSRGEGDEATREALNKALGTAAATGSTVTLAEVVPGAWTRVLFVCPYEDEKSVTARLGFTWDDFPGHDDTETQATYVFASDSAVVEWATLAIHVGDPCQGPQGRPPGPPGIVPKEAAIFAVMKTDDTAVGPFYSLVQRR